MASASLESHPDSPTPKSFARACPTWRSGYPECRSAEWPGPRRSPTPCGMRSRMTSSPRKPFSLPAASDRTRCLDLPDAPFESPNSPRGHRHPEESHLVRERLAKAHFERPRIEPERSTGLLIAPEVGDPREVAEAFRPGQTRDSSKETRRDLNPWHGDSRDSFGNLEGLDQRMPWSCEDVRFSRNSLLHREEVPAGRVIDMGPAVGGFLWQGEQAAPKISDQGRPDLARVPRAVIQARLHNHEREALADHWLGHLVVRDPFRPIVLGEPRALAIMAVRLIHELTMGVGEDGERARVDAFRDPQFPHRGQDVPRAEDVDAFALFAVLRPDLVPARDVEDAVDPGHGRPERFGDRDVPRADVDPEFP